MAQGVGGSNPLIHPNFKQLTFVLQLPRRPSTVLPGWGSIFMKILRILLHSFVLAIANVGSIIAGFGIYQILKPANQIAVQAPSAVVFSVIAFLLWSFLFRSLSITHLSLQERNEIAWMFVFALVWAPIIFVPLHYVTQGYLTAFGNILGIWLFQVPTNFLAIVVARKLSCSNKGAREVVLT